MATQTAGGSDFIKQLGRMYGTYTGGFIGFIILLAILEQVGVPNRVLGYLFVFLHAGGLCRYRRDDANRAAVRILCRRPARARFLQRHGDRRRLDVGGLLRRHGRHTVPARLRRAGLGVGMDRRLRAGVDPDRTISAQVRRLYRSRLHGVPFRRQFRPRNRSGRAGVLLLHLRDGADLRHRSHRLALPRHAVRDRGVRWPGRHPALRDAGRHAGGDLDADRPVHRADRRLPHADRDPVDQALRHSDPGTDIRNRDRGNHGARTADAGDRLDNGGGTQAAHSAVHQL